MSINIYQLAVRTIFQLTSPDRTSRLAGAIAVVLAASVGLAVALLVPESPISSAPTHESSDVSAIESPDTKPELDLTEIAAFYSRHVSSERGFVIFRNGSVVLFAEPCDDPLRKARDTLDRCAEPDARFVTERTGEGDVIVTFREAVLHWTPQSEVEPLQKWAAKNLGALLSDAEQATVKADWMPPADARLGLVARRRMLDDAKESKIVKVIRAKQSVTGK